MRNLLLIALLAGVFPSVHAARHNAGDYIVTLNGNEDPVLVSRFHHSQRKKTWTNAVHGFSATLTGDQADHLERDIRVYSVEPDITVHAMAQTLPTGVSRIGTASSTTAGIGGNWVKSFGSTQADLGYAVTTDSSGNIYAAGMFRGTVSFGGAPLTAAGGQDIYLAKYSKAGTFAWSKRIGGPGNENVRGICLDSSGNIIIAGTFDGTTDLGGGNVAAVGLNDIYVAKYTSAGNYVWAKTFGGSSDDTAESVATDPSGNVIFTGYFKGAVNFGGGPLYSRYNGKDTFLAKYSSSGTYVWAYNFVSNADDEGTGVACDLSGNIFLCGIYYGDLDLGLGVLPFGGGSDFFLAKFNSSGTNLFEKGFGGTAGDKAVGIGLDSSANVYMLGYFTGSISLGGSTLRTFANDDDVFLAKFNSSLAHQWSKAFPGPGYEIPYAIAVDSTGHSAITGYFQYTINLGGQAFSASGGFEDAFFAKYDTTGRYILGKSYGGASSNQGLAVALDPDGYVIGTGFLSGTSTFDGTVFTSISGGADVFLLRYRNVDADVAVIDTGIQLNHPDLNVVQNVSFVPGITTGNDDSGHGTHVAGIIGAYDNSIGVVGVAPGCRLWAVKVLDSTGAGTLSQVISGVDYVTSHSDLISVCNMSLAGQGISPGLQLAIQNSVASGILYVAPAGDNRQDIYGPDLVLGTADDYFPACYPEVMAVSGMVDTDGVSGGHGASTAYGLDDTLGTFSNFSTVSNPWAYAASAGAGIQCAAPGTGILSTWINSGYSTLTGTSMSSAHAAGAAALYLAQYGRATTASTVYARREQLTFTGDYPYQWGTNATNPNPSDQYGEPMVRVDTFAVPPDQRTNLPPTINIYEPLNGQSFLQGYPVVLIVTAMDDLGLYKLTLTSSIDGQIGVNNTPNQLPTTWILTNSTLSVGTHTLTAVAEDSGGINPGDTTHQSTTTTSTLTIVSSGTSLPKLTVAVTTDKANYARKEKATITANVKSSGVNVAGAQVAFTLQAPGPGAFAKTTYKAVTTDASGNAVWIFQVPATSYVGSWIGQANATKAGYAPGSAVINFTSYK